MLTTKKHITLLVNLYIKSHPLDYESFVKGVAMMRALTQDEFATLYGSHDTRALFEMPEDLHNDLVMGLNEEEMVWFKSKIGGRWFAKTFKDFALAESI